MRFAFEALLDAVLAQLGDRQDLYLACRRPLPKPGVVAPLRVPLRFHGAPFARLPGRAAASPAALELAPAEAAPARAGGRLRVESSGKDEQLVRVDLPAAAAEAVAGPTP